MSRGGGRYTVGVDFGTLSGRAVVVRVDDGLELGCAVHEYAHGVIDTVLPDGGKSLPADWALQDPKDWIDVLRHAVPAAVRASGVDPVDIIGIGTDFTACTVLPTDAEGVPLCERPEHRPHPHAWPKLWRHHAAQHQADRINAVAHERKEPWIGRYGGKISSEWEFAKALQMLEEDPVRWAATARWIEAADWIVWQLTGSESRNACTAGYKGIYQDGEYPSRDYLEALHPGFGDFPETRLAFPLSALGSAAGTLSAAAAAWTGLPAETVVCVGNVDAHVSAPAAQAVHPGDMLAVMGTSTCHVMTSDVLAEVPGMCGVVDGGILAGSWGYEAGQSGVGDIFAWWVEHHVPDGYASAARERGLSVHEYLTALGADEAIGAHGLLALDWHSGNRSTLVDHRLSGLIVGLTLASRPEDVYRALLESTAYGARRIVDAFTDSGVPVTRFIATGGLLRNPTLMQIYADVLGRSISIAPSAQGPALGSAIHAAVAAGAYPDVRAAEHMGRIDADVYRPDPAAHAVYDELYRDYCRLHDWFGHGEDDGGNEVMHRLRDLRDRVRQDSP